MVAAAAAAEVVEYFANVDLETRVWDYRQGLVLCSAPLASTAASFGGGSDADRYPISCSGVSSNGHLSWLTRGPRIDVVASSTGQRVAALELTTGASGSGEPLLIRHVVEVENIGDYYQHQNGGSCSSGAPLLFVVAEGGSGQSLGCLFCTGTSRARYAVDLPYTISAAGSVNISRSSADGVGGGGAGGARLGALAVFDGCVALGTDAGQVLLLDLQLRASTRRAWLPGQPSIRLEVFDDHSQSSFTHISPGPNVLVALCLSTLALQTESLDGESGPDGQPLLVSAAPGDEMYEAASPALRASLDGTEPASISGLTWLPQVRLLAVGMMTGGFYLWSPVRPDAVVVASDTFADLPVTAFGFQHCKTDPTIFNRYLWVCTSDGAAPGSSLDEAEPATVRLYTIDFSKESLDNGTHARATSCYPRWSICLGGSVRATDGHTDPELGSRLLSVSCVAGTDDEAVVTAPELAVFSWESNVSGVRETYVAVFDLDSWLSTQPGGAELALDIASELHYLKVRGGRAHSIYFTPYRLTTTTSSNGSGNGGDGGGGGRDGSGDTALALWTDPASFRKFDCKEVHGTTLKNDLGQSYWNGAFSFKANVVRAASVGGASFFGAQEQALAAMYVCGTIDEAAVRTGFETCQRVRLVNRDVEYAEDDVAARRTALWDIALANCRFGVIKSAISAAAEGGGPTLAALLAWLRKQFRVRTRLKTEDTRQLFEDHRRLEPQQMEWTVRPHILLARVRTAFQELHTHRGLQVTDAGEANLQKLWTEMQREFCHLEALNWFVVNRLVPCAALFKHTHRAELKYAHGRSEGRVLLIDTLVAAALNRNQEAAEGSGGGSGSGGAMDETVDTASSGGDAFPMGGLQALLELLRNNDTEPARVLWILYYLLLDFDSTGNAESPSCDADIVAAAAAAAELDGNALKFPFAPRFARFFEMARNTERCVRGLWLVDNGRYDEGVSLLCTCDPVLPSQHAAVLQALLNSNNSDLALVYWRARLPGMHAYAELALGLDVLLANGLPFAGYELVHTIEDANAHGALLDRFFTSCARYLALPQLLALPLDANERARLEVFLGAATDVRLRELLLLLLLQYGRVAEAYAVNASISQLPGGERRAAKRKALLHNACLMLPSCKRELVLSSIDVQKVSRDAKDEVAKQQQFDASMATPMDTATATATTTGNGVGARPQATIAPHLSSTALTAALYTVPTGAAALTQVVRAVSQQRAPNASPLATVDLPFMGPPATPARERTVDGGGGGGTMSAPGTGVTARARPRTGLAVAHARPVTPRAVSRAFNLETSEGLLSPFGTPDARSPAAFSPLRDHIRRLGADPGSGEGSVLAGDVSDTASAAASPVRLQPIPGATAPTPKSILGVRHTPNRVQWRDQTMSPAAATAAGGDGGGTPVDESFEEEVVDEEITFNIRRRSAINGSAAAAEESEGGAVDDVQKRLFDTTSVTAEAASVTAGTISRSAVESPSPLEHKDLFEAQAKRLKTPPVRSRPRLAFPGPAGMAAGTPKGDTTSDVGAVSPATATVSRLATTSSLDTSTATTTAATTSSSSASASPVGSAHTAPSPAVRSSALSSLSSARPARSSPLSRGVSSTSVSNSSPSSTGVYGAPGSGLRNGVSASGAGSSVALRSGLHHSTTAATGAAAAAATTASPSTTPLTTHSASSPSVGGAVSSPLRPTVLRLTPSASPASASFAVSPGGGGGDFDMSMNADSSGGVASIGMGSVGATPEPATPSSQNRQQQQQRSTLRRSARRRGLPPGPPITPVGSSPLASSAANSPVGSDSPVGLISPLVPLSKTTATSASSATPPRTRVRRATRGNQAAAPAHPPVRHSMRLRTRAPRKYL